jgi:hypothetical protein
MSGQEIARGRQHRRSETGDAVIEALGRARVGDE